MTPQEVLTRVPSALDAWGWHQGDYVGPNNEICLVQAICDIALTVEAADGALDRLEKVIGRKSVSKWQDAPNRTLEEVKAACIAASRLP